MRTKLKYNCDDIIILLDFNNQVWRNHHATEKRMSPNSDGINTGSAIGLMKTLMHSINRAKESCQTTELVICEDRVPERKRKLYQNNQLCFKDYIDDKHPIILYKGNRKSKDLDYNPVEICSEYMSCIPHTKIYKDGEEADDVLASFIRKNSNRKIFLYSSDRDMWQLLDEYKNLRIFLGGDGEEPTQELLSKKFQTDSFQKVILHKIIRGDSGDNVKGVKNFPFKKSLEAYTKCNGTIESFFYYLCHLYGKNSKQVTQLLQEHNLALIKLNQKLVSLKTDIDYTVELIKKEDREKWKHLCHMFETPSLLHVNLSSFF